MVAKPYEWLNGAALDDHTRRKHKILHDYFLRYLQVRCQLPQQSKFRLAIVEGFAGGGRYKCGASGSPLIFIETLREATSAFNIRRKAEGMATLDIECLLILNDQEAAAIEMLKTHVVPLLVTAKDEEPRLHLHVEYRSEEFEKVYPEVKQLLERGGYQSVLFNLDQCGHSHVTRDTLADIATAFTSAEIFYTFMISSLLTYLQKDNLLLVQKRLGFLGSNLDLTSLEGMMNNQHFLGAAERLVFDSFRSCADFVSPFSVNNPDGWRYWLIHFSNNYRARQEYNNVLHRNSSSQAHFGRSGLDMLLYDPADTANDLYLFDVSDRERAKSQLLDDIPRLINRFGDAVNVGELYGKIYNMTPSHTDDIHAAMIENPDLEVITENGGERRKANTITPGDTLRLKKQTSFFPVFFNDTKKK